MSPMSPKRTRCCIVTRSPRSVTPVTKAWKKRTENLGKTVTWHVAMKRSKRKALPNNKLGLIREKLEYLKASVRAKVEHPFHAIKNLFRHRKTRYRGLAKNTAQLFTLFGFANLVLAGRRLTITETRRAS